MTRSEEAGNNGLRNVLRGTGTVLVLVGLVLAGIGISSFFAAFNSGGESTPDKFWMTFLGLPMIGIGGWCLVAGFFGAAARFAIREGTPLINQFGAALGRSTPLPPPTAASGSSAFCTRCGKPMTSGSRFCGSCGASA